MSSVPYFCVCTEASQSVPNRPIIDQQYQPGNIQDFRPERHSSDSQYAENQIWDDQYPKPVSFCTFAISFPSKLTTNLKRFRLVTSCRTTLKSLNWRNHKYCSYKCCFCRVLSYTTIQLNEDLFLQAYIPKSLYQNMVWVSLNNPGMQHIKNYVES